MLQEKEPVYFADFRKFVVEKFEGIDKKFEGIDKRFDEVDKRFDDVGKKFDGVENRFTGVDGEFKGIKSSLDKIIENQETHFEAIGEVKMQITGIETMLKDKAEQKDLRILEKRTQKLEKAVFA